MAKQPEDTKTRDLLDAPAPRGRKPTGNALTNAQKQAAYRARKNKAITAAVRNRGAADTTTLVQLLEWQFKHSDRAMIEKTLAELSVRASLSPSKRLYSA